MKKFGSKKLKKTLAGISAICIAAAAVPLIPSGAATMALGDVDMDGSVTVFDQLMLKKYILNQSGVQFSTTAAKLADANQDGLIDIVDAVCIRKSVLTGKVTTIEIDEDVTDITYIHLNGSSISTEGKNASVSGSKVTISASGTYYIDGTLNDGQIYVNVPDETVDTGTVKLFLNGAEINGLSQSAVFIENAENTSINLVSGTKNVINDGTTAYSGDYLDCAVIHAKDDMTIKGEGSLEINANTQYAIHCNNDLKFNGGTVNINTASADAVRGKKSVTIKNGIINIDSAGDGIKSTKGNVSIEGGTVGIKASNDAVQAETTIDISAGNITASGDRGLTSVTGTNITGGTVVATATDNQAEFVNAAQGTMFLNCIDDTSNTDGCWKKSNKIAVSGSVTASPLKKFKYVLISDASIKQGSSYTLTNGSTKVTHSNGASSSFSMASASTVFDNVNLGTASSAEPSTEGYTITLSSSGISTNAPSEAASVSSNVLTIKQPGVFSVSGTMTGGQIVVDVDKTAYPDGVVELDLMGANLTNTSTSPIYVAAIGDECQIVAKKGYENTISDGTSYTNADGKAAAIYACDDLKIKGSGTLTVNGNCDEGIACKNDIKLWNGNIKVNAVGDGIRGKDSVKIGDADSTDYSGLNVTVKSTGADGIKSTNSEDTGKGYVMINGGTVNINAYEDGIQGEQSVEINGGTIDIYTYQGSAYGGTSGNTGSTRPGPGGMGGDGNSNKTENSAKGIKAVGLYDTAGTTYQSAGDITINGGKITVDSSDDSLHCAGKLTVTGGNLTLSTGDDGMHSDSDLIIGTAGKETDYSSPYIEILKSYEGVEGVNITQNSGTVIVTSRDDGYNAAGGTDSSGTQNPGGWNPGGWGGQGGGNYTLTFNGGYTYVNAAGDGLDSNGSLTVNGGYVFVSQTGGGNSPIDCDSKWSYNGGVVIAGGSSDMFSESIPASYNFVNRSASISAGTTITAVSGSNVIGTMTFANSAAAIVICTPESSVSVYSGGTLSGTTYFSSSSANTNMKAGYGGTISGGTQLSSNSSSGGNNPWGF